MASLRPCTRTRSPCEDEDMDSDDGERATPDAFDNGTDEKMKDNTTGQVKGVEVNITQLLLHLPPLPAFVLTLMCYSSQKSNHPAPMRTNKRGGTKNDPKKLKPKNKKDKKTTIPASYETASMEDRMLLHMKEVEMKSWSEIRTQWEAMTGTKVGNSTLSTRYLRIKAKLAGFKPEDVSFQKTLFILPRSSISKYSPFVMINRTKGKKGSL